jgi:hypothetical protein
MRAALVTVFLSSLAAASPEELRPSPELAQSSVELRARPADGPRRWGLVAAGAMLFVAGYAADVGVTYGMGHADPSWSLIPVFGPLIQLGDSFQIADPNAVKTGNPSVDQRSSQMINSGNQAYRSIIYTGLVLDAALQIAGVVTAIVGAASKSRRPPPLGAGRLSFTF